MVRKERKIITKATSEDSNNEILCALGKLPAYNYGRLLDSMCEMQKSAARVLFSTDVSNDAESYCERKTARCRRSKKYRSMPLKILSSLGSNIVNL
jgi:hypothetical protein